MSNFTDFFKGKLKEDVEIDWRAWFDGTGMPPVENKFDETLCMDVAAVVRCWSEDRGRGAKPTDIEKWHTLQVLLLLDSLQQLQKDEKAGINSELLGRLGEMYKFGESGNAEILFRWATVCLRADMKSAVPLAAKLLSTQGRMKFTRPLFRDLFASSVGKATAVKVFEEQKESYHPICAKMVARDIETARGKN